MSCPTIADAPWFGPSPCSSHGTCDNSTSLCVCSSGFSGGGDLFELRVFGIQSQDCGLSTLGVTIAWSITFASALFRLSTSIVALLIQLLKKKNRDLAHQPVLQVLLADALVCNPMWVALTALKVFGGQVIGTDAPVTVLFALGVPMTFLSINYYSVEQFRVIQLSSDSKIFEGYRKSAYAAPALYFLFASIPVMCSLALDKTKGPTASGQVVILIFRIFMVCLFQLIGLKNSIKFVREAEDILHTAPPLAENNSTRDKVVKIVEYMNVQALATKKKAIVLLFLHAPFLTPYLWQQQALLIAISVTLISLSNPALAVLRMRRVGRAVATTGSGSPKSARNEALKPFMGQKISSNPIVDRSSTG